MAGPNIENNTEQNTLPTEPFEFNYMKPKRFEPGTSVTVTNNGVSDSQQNIEQNQQAANSVSKTQEEIAAELQAQQEEAQRAAIEAAKNPDISAEKLRDIEYQESNEKFGEVTSSLKSKLVYNPLTKETTAVSWIEETPSIYTDGVSAKGKFVTGEPVVDSEDNPYSKKNKTTIKNDGEDNAPLVFFPIYKITDYTKDLNNWRKQVNPFGIKGCFYFKIFFNFDSNYGLLGDTEASNSALRYIKNLIGVKYYESDKLLDRARALKKFIESLKNISINTPWFFREVTNLNNMPFMFINEDDFSTEKYINIHCLEESTDMRLGTLFDLYKFACYNTIRNKEIIPVNLRKFDLSILFMHVPLKKYHLSFESLTGTKFKDKEINFTANDYENIMSVKMLTFQNCEFDPKSLSEFNDSVSNENTFDLGGNNIRINYDRVYEHRINEFQEIAFGQDGIIFDKNDIQKTRKNTISRLEAIADDVRKVFDAHTPQDEKDIYENLYGNFTNPKSQYYTKKLDIAKNGSIAGGNIYNYDFGRIGSGEFRKNTNYLESKLESIKKGKEYDYNENLANRNEFKLKWDANALNYNNNALNVEGNPGTKKTWIGKLSESTWQRIKSGFGF